MSIKDVVMSQLNISNEELSKKIEEKKRKYDGFVNDDVAVFLIAKENNIKIPDDNFFILPLNMVEEHSGPINVFVTVKRVFKPKEYTKKRKTYSKKSKFMDLIVFDDTKTMRLTVWDRIPEIKVGDKVLFKWVYPTKFKDEIKLNTTWFSEIEVKGHDQINQKPFKKFIEVKDFSGSFIFSGKLLRAYPSRTFLKDGKERKVKRCLFFDGQIVLPVIFWGKAAETINFFKEGQILKIDAGYVKKGRNLEIHVNDDVLITEETDFKIEPLSFANVWDGCDCVVKARFFDLVRYSSFFICKECGTRMEEKEGLMFCPKCNRFTESEERIVAVFRSEGFDFVFFTDPLKRLFGTESLDEIKNKLENFNNFDKEYLIRGIAKKKDFGYFEFIVRDLWGVNDE